MSGGLLWETLRPSAMKLVAPFNIITIDLDAKDQNQLKDLIEMQEATGDYKKSLGTRSERIKVCNIPWKNLKKIVMQGDKNFKQLRIPLTDNE